MVAVNEVVERKNRVTGAGQNFTFNQNVFSGWPKPLPNTCWIGKKKEEGSEPNKANIKSWKC